MSHASTFCQSHVIILSITWASWLKVSVKQEHNRSRHCRMFLCFMLVSWDCSLAEFERVVSYGVLLTRKSSDTSWLIIQTAHVIMTSYRTHTLFTNFQAWKVDEISTFQPDCTANVHINANLTNLRVSQRISQGCPLKVVQFVNFVDFQFFIHQLSARSSSFDAKAEMFWLVAGWCYQSTGMCNEATVQTNGYIWDCFTIPGSYVLQSRKW